MDTLASLPAPEPHSDILSSNESDERYQRLLDMLPDGVVLHSEGIVLLVNKAAMSIMRVQSPDELIGKQLLSFIHPDYLSLAIERQKQMLSTLEIAPLIEEVIVRLDGTQFYAETMGSVVMYQGKKAIQVVFRDISERKKAFDKMRISEESFRAMFESNPHAMGVFDKETYKLLEVNSGFTRLYGYTREELLGGMTAMDLRPKEDIEEFLAYMHTLRDSHEEFLSGSTWRHIKKDGTCFYVQLTSYEILFNNQPARHILVNDITEYRQSKAELLKANKRFELVTHATNDIIWDVDLRTNVIWWNDNFYSKFCYTKENEYLSTSSWADHVHPDDKDAVIAGIYHCIERKCPLWSAEYRFITADERIVHVYDRGNILYNEHGEATRIVGAMQDITERKREQEALRLSQSRLKTIFESALDAMITVDEEMKVMLFNSAAEQMFGYSAREILGQSLDLLIPLKYRWGHALAMKNFGDNKQQSREMGFTHEVFALRSNGQEFPIEASISTVNTETGRLYTVVIRDSTEKKIAEDRLRNSEEKFRTVVQNLTDIVTILDQNGVLLYESPAITSTLGYEQDEILGRSVLEFLHPEDLENVVEAMTEVLKDSGKSKRVEYRFLAKDGHYVTLESVGVNQLQNPAIEGIVVTSRDMTERTMAEEALRRSEEKFRSIMENSKIGFTLFSRDATILYVSPTNDQIFGYTQDELQTMNRDYLIHPEDRARTESRFNRLLTGEEVARVEFRWLMKDGKWKWIESNAYNYLDNKSLQAILVTYQDVNQRHESDEKIRHQAAMLDIVPDAILLQELDGKILFWNKGAEKMYGWTAEEVVGHPWTEVLPDDNPSDIAERLDHLFHYGKWSGDRVHRTKNKETLLIESRWELIKNESAHQTVLVTNRDITEKRSLEKQLFRAQRLESIGTLASGIAHDLNNILTPVVLGLEIIKIRSKDEAIAARIDALTTNIQRGSGLIRQVLTFARGTEEKFEVINIKYSISEVIKMARETFPPEIKVTVNIPTEDVLIHGNATQLHQIILNLSINARDAMSKGGGELYIEAGYTEATDEVLRRFVDMKPGKYVRITVRDTGCGIPAELQEKIFEPFFTTKEVGKGTGIGLTTVFSIVRSHNGYIDFTSKEHVGTTFTILLPAAVMTMEKQEFSTTARKSNGDHKTVLLVEDEELLRATAEDVLHEHNYTVLTASNGEEAMHIYTHQQETIVVVITDIVMPIMNGMELIKILKSINPAVKIIATGGLLYDQEGKYIKKMGAFEVLLKPYTATQLLDTVEKAILARQ